MPTWEKTKRAAQTAFVSRGNGFQDVHGGIGDMYRQIAEGNMEPPEAQQPEIYRSVGQERDIEPER